MLPAGHVTGKCRTAHGAHGALMLQPSTLHGRLWTARPTGRSRTPGALAGGRAATSAWRRTWRASTACAAWLAWPATLSSLAPTPRTSLRSAAGTSHNVITQSCRARQWWLWSLEVAAGAAALACNGSSLPPAALGCQFPLKVRCRCWLWPPGSLRLLLPRKHQASLLPRVMLAGPHRALQQGQSMLSRPCVAAGWAGPSAALAACATASTLCSAWSASPGAVLVPSTDILNVLSAGPTGS